MSVRGPDGTMWPADSLRGIEHESIRDFVLLAAQSGYLSGRVLDYGCGKQPYRNIVESVGGHYIGYDDPRHPGSVVDEHVGDWSETDPMDAVLCTQVLQYVPDVPSVLTQLHRVLFLRNSFDPTHLVLTYPTNWPEVESADLHRFTKAGMERLLTEAGFAIVLHERRAQVAVMRDASAVMALGYGVVARA